MTTNPFEPIVPKCENCRFWQQYEGTKMGDCRRYAPRPNADLVKVHGKNESNFRVSHWVWTSLDDWCGEWSQGSLNE